MMKGYIKALVGFLMLFSTSVFSGEITDKEWIFPGFLSVTYYHDGAYSKVNCMAFNEQGKPIGSGSSVPNDSGLARIFVTTPIKYYDTELKVSCKKGNQEEGSISPVESKSEEQSSRVAAEVKQLQNELQEEERGLKETRAQSTVKRNLADEYKAKILAKIKSNIIMPTELSGNPVAEFDVTLVPGGEVISVTMRTSSGFTHFDKAVERAIVKSRPLPLPPDPSLFPNFRNLSLKVDYL